MENTHTKLKSTIKFIREFVSRHPLISLVIVGAIAALLLIYLPDRGSGTSEKYTRKQIQAKERTFELEIEAREYEAKAEVYRERVSQSEERLKKTSEHIKRKKEYAEKKHDETTDSGHRAIDIDDIPTNFELCTRANSLGIRCDFDK